jgi:hypothetical protein
MGRITPFIAAVVIAMVPACKRERSEPVSTPKTTEPTPGAAQDEAESALDTAREAKATAESALATAREAQAAADRTAAPATPGVWWNRAQVESTEPEVEAGPATGIADRNAATPEALGQPAREAQRISVAGRVTESGLDRLVVEPVVGSPLAARVDAGTQVTVGGRAASAADLAPGTEVRLLYHLDGAQVIAERVDVPH